MKKKKEYRVIFSSTNEKQKKMNPHFSFQDDIFKGFMQATKGGKRIKLTFLSEPNSITSDG